MVGNPLHIGNGVQEGIENSAVGNGQAPAGQLHEISAQSILIAVSIVFQFQHPIQALSVKLLNQPHGQTHGLGRILRHPGGNVLGALNGNRRGGQQTLVQQHRLLLLLAIRHGQGCQLHKQAVHGKQQSGDTDVEGGVDDRDVHLAAGIPQEIPGMEQADSVEYQDKNQTADDIEVQVHHGRPPGILVGADGAHHRRNTGADILTQDYRDGAAVGHNAGGAQALQNAHGGRGGLDNGSQRRAYQNSHQRIGEGNHHPDKPGLVLQKLHGAAHQLHAGHQSHEAQQNPADVLLFLGIGKHVQHNSHAAQQRSQGGRLKQLHKQTVSLQTAQGQNPGSDRGAHVAAHDDTHGLLQGQNAGVDEAHHHYRGGRGGLNHRRHRKTQQKALGHIGAHLRQNGLKLAAGGALQGLTHGIHAEQEQCQTPQQGNQLQKIKSHACLSLSLFQAIHSIL